MRLHRLRLTCLLLFALLGVRLFSLSILHGKPLAEQAMAQRTKKVVVQNTRGIIYDRGMRKLTDTQTQATQVAGVPPLYISKRYHNGLLSHVIGYLTADSGGFGVEKAFDELLKDNQPATLSIVKDAKNQPIHEVGYGLTQHPVYEGIKLSIDYYIQALTERAMDEEQINGAAIVVDAESGDILAMASRPNFSQDNIADYLDSKKGELINRALTAYDLGSVFKILVTSAALENGFSHEMLFDCTGSTMIDGMEFVCGRKEGHGHLTLQEGFALSCNSVYYQVGQALGIGPIAEYARAFGFGEQVLGINGMAESKGNVPHNPHAPPREIANLSIGQGSIQATPIQVADMVCTIVNDGKRKQLTLIKSLISQSGQGRDVEPVTLDQVISTDTARIVKNLMLQTVSYGTGTGANITEWGAGGKTGSAQTGWEVDGKTMTHGWFAGFFPAQNPKYVCVVLAENGHSGAESAIPVFRKIGEEIRQLGR